MSVHYTYAQIYNGKVENTFVCDNFELANLIARCAFGDEAFAIEISQYPTQIGDSYRDGSFYRTNEETGEEIEIPYIPTDSQKIFDLEQENARLIIQLESTASQLTDTQLALTEQYEENIALQEEVTNTQLALTELYEAM